MCRMQPYVSQVHATMSGLRPPQTMRSDCSLRAHVHAAAIDRPASCEVPSQTTAMVEIEQATMIKAPWIKDGVLLGRTLLHPEGHQVFLHLCKCEHKIHRLLTGRSVGNSRALTCTSLLKTLADLRLRKIAELLGKTTAEESLGLDELPAPKRKKGDQGILPPIVEIDAPAVGLVKGRTLALLSKPHGLWVECTAGVIEWLHDALAYEISSAPDESPEASAPKHDPSTEAPCKGVFWSASRKCFRAKYTEGGRTKMKDFRGPTASADAMEFVQLRDRPAACD